MATETKTAEPQTVAVIADRWLYLSEDGRVVEKGDTSARSLLAAPGSMIEPATAQRYGLSLKGGKVTQKSPKERAADAREAGIPLDLGTPNEGQIREPGKPLILVPRTGRLVPEATERVVYKHGDEVEMVPKATAELVPKDVATVSVSNVPVEDDELRAQVAEETGDGEAAEEKEETAPRAKKTRAKRAARK